MLSYSAYKSQPAQLADVINWNFLAKPGVLQNHDGSLMSVIRFRGPDLDSATGHEMVRLCKTINDSLKRLPTGFALYFEAKRELVSHKYESNWDNTLAYLVDEERRFLFEKNDNYETSFYLTLIYAPPPEVAQKLLSSFTKTHGQSLREQTREETFSLLEKESERILQTLIRLLPEAENIEGSDLLTYLRGTLEEKGRVTPRLTNLFLNHQLVTRGLVSSYEPQLGVTDPLHLKIIGIKSFPLSSHPSHLANLYKIDEELRLLIRYIPLSQEQASRTINRFRSRYLRQVKDLFTVLKEEITRTESHVVNTAALNKASEAASALELLDEQQVSFGYITPTIVLADKDKERLEAKAKRVLGRLEHLGFVAQVEDINAVDAWLGTLPGNCRNNVRRPLMHSLNFVHMAPLSAVWCGPHWNEHLDGPPLLLAKTSDGDTFRYVTHVGGVGHTLIVGVTGSGKSVLLALMMLQFKRYENAQVFCFDKGASSLAVTAGSGGDFYDLGKESESFSLQPFVEIEDHNERVWAQEFLSDILESNGIKVTAKKKDALWSALGVLASNKKERRTFSTLHALVQDAEIKSALISYTVKGPYGRILDADRDTFGDNPWQVFEMESLMKTKGIVAPVLSCIFHKLEKRFDGRPTMLVLDEAWLFLDNSRFAQKIREWLKVLRKKNVMVVFATQELSDVLNSSIATTIEQSCPTKIFLPNDNAIPGEAVYELYKRFHLNERQIEIIREAEPRRQYYYVSRLGNRLFELALDKTAYAYCTASSQDDHRLIRTILEESLGVDDFNRRYLNARGLVEVVPYYESIAQPRRKIV